MGDRSVSAAGDSSAQLAAAHAAVAPWLDSLHDLERWFGENAPTIWPGAGVQRAREVLTLLRQALEAMARGEQAVARSIAPPRAATDGMRIDMLVARPARQRPPPAQADRRRAALLDLALWNALRQLDAGTTPLARLHGALAHSMPLAPGLSPTLQYAASGDARRFFGETVGGVLQTLARRCDGDGAAYAQALPPQPFDHGLPLLVAWSQAWAIAIAGAYLDNLCRHARGDLQQALRDIWSGRLAAVRFRTGPGLTALPARHGSLHLDLWTCAVKAQTLAFDPAVWQAQAAGSAWHAVRVDMHELSGNGAAGTGRAPRAAAGLSVESLYRTVFIDRLQALLARAPMSEDAAHDGAARAGEHTLTIDVDPPRAGHLPNLRLLLRWRDPAGPAARFIDGSDDVTRGTSPDALRRWLAGQGDEGVAHALDRRRIDWRAAAPQDRFVDQAGNPLLALGHGALWDAVDPQVQWIDTALMVRVDAAWYELPAVLHDQPAGAGSDRTWWLLPEGAALPPTLDASQLQSAARAPVAMHWVAHEEGVGAFVTVAIDVDACRAEPAT
jgi:hypothetical protein